MQRKPVDGGSMSRAARFRSHPRQLAVFLWGLRWRYWPGLLTSCCLPTHNQDLPDYNQLASYDPADGDGFDGRVLAEYAAEEAAVRAAFGDSKTVAAGVHRPLRIKISTSTRACFTGIARAIRSNIVNYGQENRWSVARPSRNGW